MFQKGGMCNQGGLKLVVSAMCRGFGHMEPLRHPRMCIFAPVMLEIATLDIWQDKIQKNFSFPCDHQTVMAYPHPSQSS